MITGLMLALALHAPDAVAATDARRTVLQDPPVRVWLSKRDAVERGDRIKVRVRTAEDGYLIVLHADPEGRVRVLFPLDPVDDHFIRGGRDYEVRGRGDREAITVNVANGLGTVYAAFSRDPFRFDGLVRNTHWDYAQTGVWRVGDDPEGELTTLVDTMAPGSRVVYDLVYYDVYDTVAYTRRYHPGYYGSGYYDPFYCDVFYCSPFYLYGGRGYRPGVHIGIGIGFGHGYYDPFYYPSYYDPFFYPFYDPFFFGFGHGFRRHYAGFYPRGRTIYVGNRVIDRGFTFKPGQRSFGESIDMRRRPTPVATRGGSTRVAPTTARLGRRTTGDAARRPNGSVGESARRQAPSGATSTRRTPSGQTRRPGVTSSSSVRPRPQTPAGRTPQRVRAPTPEQARGTRITEEQAINGNARRHYVVRIHGGQSTTGASAESHDGMSPRTAVTPAGASSSRAATRALSPTRSSPSRSIRSVPQSPTRSGRSIVPSRSPNQRPTVRQSTPRSTTRALPRSPRSIQRAPRRSSSRILQGRSPARLSRPSVRSRSSRGSASPSRRTSPRRPK